MKKAKMTTSLVRLLIRSLNLHAIDDSEDSVSEDLIREALKRNLRAVNWSIWHYLESSASKEP
jgi:hypothetical protein